MIRKGPFITQLITPGLTVSVPGYADIFLAGRSFPLNVTGPFGTDIAQRNGPARVKIEVPGGHAITIATKFGTSHGFSILPAKDANGYVKQSILAGPSEPGATKVGISSVRAPIDSLVGVFTGKKPNKGKAPTKHGSQGNNSSAGKKGSNEQRGQPSDGSRERRERGGEGSRYLYPNGAGGRSPCRPCRCA